MEKSIEQKRAEVVGVWKDKTPVSPMRLSFDRPCVYNLNNSLVKCFQTIQGLFVEPGDPGRIHYQYLRNRIINRAFIAIQTVYN